MARKQDQSEPKVFTAKQAAEYLGKTEQQVKSLMRRGKLLSVEHNLEALGMTVKVIEQAVLDAYLAQETEGHKESKAYIVRLTKAQREVLQPILEQYAVTLEQRYSYDPDKAKAYRVARKGHAANEEEMTDEPDESTDDDASADDAQEGV